MGVPASSFPCVNTYGVCVGGGGMINVHMKKAEKDARPPAPSGFTFDLGSH